MRDKFKSKIDAIDILHRLYDEQGKEYDKNWWLDLFPWMADKRLKAMETILNASEYLMLELINSDESNS